MNPTDFPLPGRPSKARQAIIEAVKSSQHNHTVIREADWFARAGQAYVDATGRTIHSDWFHDDVVAVWLHRVIHWAINNPAGWREITTGQ